jgi:hypothetical protein
MSMTVMACDPTCSQGARIAGASCSSVSPRERARSSSSAQDEARTLEHGYRGTEHLLLGVLASSRGVAGRETIRRTIARMLADTGSGEA